MGGGRCMWLGEGVGGGRGKKKEREREGEEGEEEGGKVMVFDEGYKYLN